VNVNTPDTPLTERQAEILRFLIREQETGGRPTTYRAINAAFDFSGPNAALAHIKALDQKGYVRREKGARGIRVLRNPDGTPYAPTHCSEAVRDVLRECYEFLVDSVGTPWAMLLAKDIADLGVLEKETA
jgi:SOS-response transcriptional repressor LexA